ncbi:MAG: hypothetical protein HONBIEJF_02336 [Fimbriimonadaceae bacterium]|nr:hypothetical protein [Fimbriimonadaceae bacterium]
MVYSAWMRQAMDGRLLFDNRFSVEPQPGLTVHLYFLVLGWLAKVIGLVGAATLGRVGFTFLFVMLLAKFCSRLTEDVFIAKLMITLTMVGGGIGFLVWQPFGVDVPPGSVADRLLQGGLPIDVWQPEAFVFPSLLTNGLFMVSLCLILGIFIAVLDAREGWRPVAFGGLMMLILMNIHSYDVLLIALVLVAFLVTQVVAKSATIGWVARSVVIGLCAIPAAAWFLYVLKNDPVFQARAATETYSRGFRATFAGLLPQVALALIGFAGAMVGRKGLVRVVPAVLLITGLVALARPAENAYWMQFAAWGAVYSLAIFASASLATERPALNLVTAWALVGLVAPYFPGLYQRKLAMGLSIPWCILAAVGIAWAVMRIDRGARNLATALGILVISGSSMLWLQRMLKLVRDNVSNTTVHALFMPRDVVASVDVLNRERKRVVVIAPPGVPAPTEVTGEFASPLLPDWNPVLAGLTGAYAYAGHWSETVDYADKRTEVVTALYDPAQSSTVRQAFLDRVKPDYILGLKPEASQGTLFDVRGLGEVVVDGSTYVLVKLRR